MSKLSSTIIRKFTEVNLTPDWEILTDTGWADVESSNKTIPYRRWKIVLENGYWLECADTHILFDEEYKEIFVKDIQIGSKVWSDAGLLSVISVESFDDEVEMYDISVNSKNHRFYSNGILSHNSSASVGYMLHYLIFNESKTAALLANKASTSREILSRLKLAYELLPHWLQHGVCTWNKGDIELENGSKAIALATSSSAARGLSISLLYVDEVAFVQASQWDSFYKSVYPTISSGVDTKVILVSTPNGLNHFYKMVQDAKDKRSHFHLAVINWWDVPGRDEKWKQETIANVGLETWAQEFECEFLGSTGTLINSQTLKRLVHQNPIDVCNDINIYTHPVVGHQYALTVDCSEGVGNDSSTFSVINVSVKPYDQVATYKNNLMSPLVFPDIIYQVATKYNQAFVLIETNSTGKQVADTLNYEFGYENLAWVGESPKHGQILMGGLSSRQQNGLRTDKRSKRIGCSNLKQLLENDLLRINDFNTIMELSSFVQRGTSFEAEDGAHDDCVMNLVVFGWMSTQGYFQALNDSNARADVLNAYKEKLNAEMLPHIMSMSMLEDNKHIEVDKKTGITWYHVNNQ